MPTNNQKLKLLKTKIRKETIKILLKGFLAVHNAGVIICNNSFFVMFSEFASSLQLFFLDFTTPKNVSLENPFSQTDEWHACLSCLLVFLHCSPDGNVIILFMKLTRNIIYILVTFPSSFDDELSIFPIFLVEESLIHIFSFYF